MNTNYFVMCAISAFGRIHIIYDIMDGEMISFFLIQMDGARKSLGRIKKHKKTITKLAMSLCKAKKRKIIPWKVIWCDKCFSLFLWSVARVSGILSEVVHSHSHNRKQTNKSTKLEQHLCFLNLRSYDIVYSFKANELLAYSAPAQTN